MVSVWHKLLSGIHALFLMLLRSKNGNYYKMLIYLEKKSLYTEINIVYLTFTAYNIVREIQS